MLFLVFLNSGLSRAVVEGVMRNNMLFEQTTMSKIHAKLMMYTVKTHVLYSHSRIVTRTKIRIHTCV